MITETQAVKFKNWFVSYLDRNGSKAMDNLSPYEFLKIMPQITSTERDKLFNYVKSFTPEAFEAMDGATIANQVLMLQDNKNLANDLLIGGGVVFVISAFILYKLLSD